MKQKPLLDQILDEPVDLTSLMDKLDFTEENVVTADREQASLFLEASRYRVKKLRHRIQTESVLDSAKAQAALLLRAKKKELDLTESCIKDRLTLNPNVKAAREKYDNAQVGEEWSRLLLEAYKERGRAIKTMAEILGAEANAQVRLVRKDMEVAGFEALKESVRKKYKGKKE